MKVTPPVEYLRVKYLGHYVITSAADRTLIGQQRWVWKLLDDDYELDVIATDARGYQRNGWGEDRWRDSVAEWGVFVPVPQCPRRRQP